jgi:hypothetical protein
MHHLFRYRLFVLAAFLLATGHLWAQASADSLYGYSQVITPGIKAARDLDSNGNWVKKQVADNYRYFIYLTTKVSARVYPIEVWIKGEAFGAKPQIITETPVVHIDRTMTQLPQKQILVPKTTQNVTAIIPIPLIAGKRSERAKQLAQENELVVVYKQGGKKQYRVLKEFTELSAIAMQ